MIQICKTAAIANAIPINAFYHDSYHGMMSVQNKTRLIIVNCERTVITKCFALPIPSYSDLSTKVIAEKNFN